MTSLAALLVVSGWSIFAAAQAPVVDIDDLTVQPDRTVEIEQPEVERPDVFDERGDDEAQQGNVPPTRVDPDDERTIDPDDSLTIDPDEGFTIDPNEGPAIDPDEGPTINPDASPTINPNDQPTINPQEHGPRVTPGEDEIIIDPHGRRDPVTELRRIVAGRIETVGSISRDLDTRIRDIENRFGEVRDGDRVQVTDEEREVLRRNLDRLDTEVRDLEQAFTELGMTGDVRRVRQMRNDLTRLRQSVDQIGQARQPQQFSDARVQFDESLDALEVRRNNLTSFPGYRVRTPQQPTPGQPNLDPSAGEQVLEPQDDVPQTQQPQPGTTQQPSTGDQGPSSLEIVIPQP